MVGSNLPRFNNKDSCDASFVGVINFSKITDKVGVCKCPKVERLKIPFSSDMGLRNGERVPRCTQCGDLDCIIMGILCINCHTTDLKKCGYNKVQCNRCRLPRQL